MTTKTIKQDELEQVFFDNNCNGTFDIIPRFGKTRLGVNIVLRYLEEVKKDVIILVPTIVIKLRWESEMILVNASIPEDVHIVSAEELSKVTPFDIGMLLVDEIHLFLSEKRYYLITSTIHYTNHLFLTGSMPIGKDKRMITSISKIIAVIEEEEAIKNEWISPYVTYNVKLDFPDGDKVKYYERSIPIRKILIKYSGLHKKFDLGDGTYLFKNDVDLITSLFRGKKHYKYPYLNGQLIREAVGRKKNYSSDLLPSTSYNADIIEKWNPMQLKEDGLSFIKHIQYRNQLLIDNTAKLSAIKLIMTKLRDKRTIIFNGSINFAEDVKDILNMNLPDYNCVSYHSQTGSKTLIDPQTGDIILYKTGSKKGTPKMFGAKRIIEDIVQGITSGRYNCISVVNAFDQGLDIPNLDLVITTSGTTSTIKQKQRTFRGNSYFGNKVSTVINLYFDDFIIKDEETGEHTKIKSRDKVKLCNRLGIIDIANPYTLSNFLALIV